MKKTPITRLPNPKTEGRSPVESWHAGGNIEILQYARSLRTAANTLVGKLEVDRSAKAAWEICPVVLLYRQALEIHLKMLVGEGSNFLEKRTDPVSLSTTHSLRWLAQITCQIIMAMKWESEFKCEGISLLAEFTAMVNEVETFDPVARAIRSARTPNSVSEFYRTFDIFQFATKLDALLELLDSTADALAAEWDRREDEAARVDMNAGAIESTIQ
jgi:hypothetical protein